MKVCSKCKEAKNLSMYNKDNMSRDGLRSCCKSCHRISVRQCYAKNRDDKEPVEITRFFAAGICGFKESNVAPALTARENGDGTYGGLVLHQTLYRKVDHDTFVEDSTASTIRVKSDSTNSDLIVEEIPEYVFEDDKDYTDEELDEMLDSLMCFEDEDDIEE